MYRQSKSKSLMFNWFLFADDTKICVGEMKYKPNSPNFILLSRLCSHVKVYFQNGKISNKYHKCIIIKLFSVLIADLSHLKKNHCKKE